MEPIITTNNLCKEYRIGDNVIHAVDHVSLTIEKGMFLSIMGTSGCGKTTLLNILSGLDMPTSGEVVFDGQNLSQMNDKQLCKLRRDRIGFVYQDFNLIYELSVYENILLPGLLSGRRADKKRIESVSNSLGLITRLTHFPEELSGGERQRCAIARALINEPDVIICDEPTGNLDSKTSHEVADILRRINRDNGKTIIMVTHDNEIAGYASKILYMEDGRIV